MTRLLPVGLGRALCPVFFWPGRNLPGISIQGCIFDGLTALLTRIKARLRFVSHLFSTSLLDLAGLCPAFLFPVTQGCTISPCGFSLNPPDQCLHLP